MFPNMNWQIRGTYDIKEEKIEFEYKANCVGRIIEIKRNFIFGQRKMKDQIFYSRNFLFRDILEGEFLVVPGLIYSSYEKYARDLGTEKTGIFS